MTQRSNIRNNKYRNQGSDPFDINKWIIFVSMQKAHRKKNYMFPKLVEKNSKLK